jgi:flotillin
MSLENIQVDFTSRDEIPTRDAINVLVDAIANMSIDQDPEVLKIASSKFLGYSTDDIQKIVTPVLEGNIREIVCKNTLKELMQGDRKDFAEQIAENVKPNLNDMGLELTTFNIQTFKDRNGVIENLGIENTVAISKDAQKAKAAAEAEIAIARAEAEKAANDAHIKTQTEIALKKNEFEIKQAELKKMADIKKAEADAAYKIQREEQRKTEEITTANANLARQEKEIELKEREVVIKERMLEAEIKKTADARKYAAQQEADAKLYETQKASEAELFERQRKAEAEKFEAEQAAEATKAEAEARKIAMENEAAGIRAKGEAEAAAIQAKALAEAEGILKKAEAMKEYGEAAMADMQLEVSKAYIAQLPAIMAAAGQAYTNVDSIYMYGGDTSKLTGDIMTNVTQISEGLSKSLGIDLTQIANSFLGAKLANPNE